MDLTNFTSEGRNDYLMRPFVFPGAISSVQCDRILGTAADYSYQPGRVIADVAGYRVCQLAEIHRSVESAWLFERVFELFEAVNGAWYQFSVELVVEPFQLIRYDTGGLIKWHADTGPAETSTRKLSLTIQLSEETTYDGGGLEFSPGGEMKASRARGTGVVFPSYLTHQVTEVTRGCRHALVSWLHGPAFV